MSHAILATSIWDRLNGDQSGGIERDCELRSTNRSNILN